MSVVLADMNDPTVRAINTMIASRRKQLAMYPKVKIPGFFHQFWARMRSDYYKACRMQASKIAFIKLAVDAGSLNQIMREQIVYLMQRNLRANHTDYIHETIRNHYPLADLPVVREAHYNETLRLALARGEAELRLRNPVQPVYGVHFAAGGWVFMDREQAIAFCKRDMRDQRTCAQAQINEHRAVLDLFADQDPLHDTDEYVAARADLVALHAQLNKE